MRCNVCGSDKLVDYGARKLALCSQCNSLERTRALWLVLEDSGILRPGAVVLHLAPEHGTARRISEIVGADNYEPRDFDPKQYNFPVAEIDLVKDAETIPSKRYDLIIHSHVMEHLPCSFVAVMFHLHRALKDDGLHIFCIPIMAGRYASIYGGITNEERIKRFGQSDHIRWFGAADLESTLGMIFRLPAGYDLEEIYGRDRLLQNAIPEYIWKGFQSSTIFSMRKGDLKLVG